MTTASEILTQYELNPEFISDVNPDLTEGLIETLNDGVNRLFKFGTFVILDTEQSSFCYGEDDMHNEITIFDMNAKELQLYSNDLDWYVCEDKNGYTELVHNSQGVDNSDFATVNGYVSIEQCWNHEDLRQ